MAHAQPPVHYFHAADLPPGTVGQGQLLRGGPLRNYYQPVEVRAPAGVLVSIANEKGFHQPEPTPLKVGMLISQVYSLKVTSIRLHEGQEVFPTIEVINRLYPPRGLESKIPIPVHLTEEELFMALSGQFVTRVIYVEDRNNPLPVQDTAEFQRYFEVQPQQDPLQVADQMGKPVAILRMGSRIPTFDGTSSFPYEAAPFIYYKNGRVVTPEGEQETEVPLLGGVGEKIPDLQPRAKRTSLLNSVMRYFR